MGINPVPRLREGATPEDMTWNERFYYCLQKPFWFIAGVVVFGILVLVYSVQGQVGDLLDVAVLLIWGIGIVYLPAALPVSIIYATVLGFMYRK
ncbi:MAG: hypothetical protein E7Z72_01055 [Methanocorpusculum parvum]|nr:hypothetical protein [Methanocorpusculum parvum]